MKEIRMEVSILHCPIPTFGSWLPNRSLNKEKTVDRVSLTALPGNAVKVDAAGLLSYIFIETSLFSGLDSDLIGLDIEVKHRDSPLAHKMYQLYDLRKPATFIPLDIDTKTQTLRVLKLSAHLEVDHDHSH